MSETDVLIPVEIPDASVRDSVLPSNAIKADRTCKVCGAPIVKNGRGRPSQYCDVHKGKRSAASSSSSGVGRAAAAPAAVEAAVNNLDGLYSLLGTALFLFGAHDAASAMAQQRASLAASNREFLARDPELVKMLNKGGAATGRVGFIVTNVTTLGPVAVMAFNEIQAKRGASNG